MRACRRGAGLDLRVGRPALYRLPLLMVRRPASLVLYWVVAARASGPKKSFHQTVDGPGGRAKPPVRRNVTGCLAGMQQAYLADERAGFDLCEEASRWNDLAAREACR